MSTFKDTVKKDVKSVFINQDEFADEHVLNGQTVVCVIDEDLTTNVSDTVANPLYGVFVNMFKIYVSPDDLHNAPVEGEVLNVDGKICLVRKVSLEQGILVITAEANEQ